MSTTLEDEPPADHLLRLARSRTGRAYKAMVVDELDLRPGQVVVDLGCGPGADLLALADGVAEGGHVIGVDHDPQAVDEARRRLAGHRGVTVRRGDVHSPGLAAGTVDRVHTDRVLQHVRNPQEVLRQSYRSLRVGGRAVLAEPDWGTLAVDHPDPGLAHAYRQVVLDEVIRNPLVGRQVPRLATLAGLDVVDVQPVTVVFRDVQEADHVLGFARVTRRAVDAERLTAAQARRWLDALVGGPFLASLTLFVTTAERPG
jgi:ubiquinone/menaquinone biosynthesis C-methylase UbiE